MNSKYGRTGRAHTCSLEHYTIGTDLQTCLNFSFKFRNVFSKFPKSLSKTAIKLLLKSNLSKNLGKSFQNSYKKILRFLLNISKNSKNLICDRSFAIFFKKSQDPREDHHKDGWKIRQKKRPAPVECKIEGSMEVYIQKWAYVKHPTPRRYTGKKLLK